MTTHSLKNVIRFKLAEAFAEVCGVLSRTLSAEALEVSLLELSMHSDRPLPVVFLDYPLRRLITGDFDTLFDTAGVGPKKFAILVQILRRAAGLEDINLQGAEWLAADAARGVSPQVIDEAGLRARFRDVCEDLLEIASNRLLTQRIDFWVLPSDRQVPRNVLHHQLGEVLGSPYDAIAALPGVGPKKISMLVEFLTRALCDAQQSKTSLPAPAKAEPQSISDALQGSLATTRENADEAAWSQWCATIVRLKLEHESLGRFARTLGNLARHLWRAPLGRFVHLTMAQVASQGDLTPKQARDVVEVFADVHSMVEQLGEQPAHLSIGVVPRMAGRMNSWASLACQQPVRLNASEIERELIRPLLVQLKIDLGQPALRLEEWWRKAEADLHNFRVAGAVWAGDGSARATLLIDDARTVVDVRWKEGAGWMRRLCEQARASRLAARDVLTIECACEFFFPDARLAARGPQLRPQAVSAPREVFPLAVGHRGPRSPARDSHPGGESRHVLRALDPLSPSRVEAR